MKKPKVVSPFSFSNISHQDMVNMINISHPINLKYNEDLVNKVHSRYPIIDKSKVAFVIRAVFQSFRDLLILGKVLNFNNLFFDTKFFIFKYTNYGKSIPAIKICISTPPPFKKLK